MQEAEEDAEGGVCSRRLEGVAQEEDMLSPEEHEEGSESGADLRGLRRRGNDGRGAVRAWAEGSASNSMV